MPTSISTFVLSHRSHIAGHVGVVRQVQLDKSQTTGASEELREVVE